MSKVFHKEHPFLHYYLQESIDVYANLLGVNKTENFIKEVQHDELISILLAKYQGSSLAELSPYDLITPIDKRLAFKLSSKEKKIFYVIQLYEKFIKELFDRNNFFFLGEENAINILFGLLNGFGSNYKYKPIPFNIKENINEAIEILSLQQNRFVSDLGLQTYFFTFDKRNFFHGRKRRILNNLKEAVEFFGVVSKLFAIETVITLKTYDNLFWKYYSMFLYSLFYYENNVEAGQKLAYDDNEFISHSMTYWFYKAEVLFQLGDLTSSAEVISYNNSHIFGFDIVKPIDYIPPYYEYQTPGKIDFKDFIQQPFKYV